MDNLPRRHRYIPRKKDMSNANCEAINGKEKDF